MVYRSTGHKHCLVYGSTTIQAGFVVQHHPRFGVKYLIKQQIPHQNKHPLHPLLCNYSDQVVWMMIIQEEGASYLAGGGAAGDVGGARAGWGARVSKQRAVSGQYSKQITRAISNRYRHFILCGIFYY